MNGWRAEREAVDPQPRSARRVLVGVLAEPRYLRQREPAELVAKLCARGVHVRVAASGGPRIVSLLSGCDLVVARGRSEALLDTLAALEACGVAVVNPPAAIAAVVDKARMAHALAGADVRSPETLAVGRSEIADAAERVGFPAVVKPVFGDNGRGIAVLEGASDAAALAWTEPRALVQPLLPSGGWDLKLYGAAGEVWAVEKPSPLGRNPAPARRVPLTPDARALALRCGALFGLDLYGVDCVATPAGLSVIEVNDFPNYSAIPEADERIADFVLSRARGEMEHRGAP